MGIRVGRNSPKSAVIANADDVTLLLTSPSEIPKLQAILDHYGKAYGAKINIQKSKAMAVGMWDTTVSIMGYRTMKILGFHLTSTASQSALKSWSVVTDELRAQEREACYRGLSLNKRTHFVHIYMLTRAWFAAQIFPMPPTCERQINTAITWEHFQGTTIHHPTAEATGWVGLDKCRCEKSSIITLPLTNTKYCPQEL